ncbi:MAG: hypothetical protein HY304_07985 [candidate division Zixibacteria bacterium]|nr:hypothetical protein [candidate division Zixibacteria bacterium]
MARRHLRWFVWAVCLGWGLAATAQGQSLRRQLEGVFNDPLAIELAGPPGTQHGDHFKPENVKTSGRIISTISDFVANNTASFPLSSTAAGITFDFSSGVPVATTSSAGPIFAERAQTLGKNKLNVGANFSRLNLNKLRGIPTDDLRFTFTHQNVGDTSVFGDSPNEFDAIVLEPHLDLNVSIVALHATYGLTDRLDVGIALPLVNVSLKAKPFARINSFTYAHSQHANHFYGGTSENPVLTLSAQSVDDVASGVGDVALRAKDNIYRGDGLDLGILAEVRLPTGRAEDLLGAGKSSVKAALIASAAWGNVSPHLNLGYNWRAGDLYRDRVELIAGYDMKATDKVTLAAEWLGQFEIGREVAALRFPEPTQIQTATPDGGEVTTIVVAPTNIPNRSHDHVMNSSFGIKYAPKANVILVANVMLPVNDGGLRSNFVPTVGVEVNF